MSELQFPKDPIVGQQYDFPPYKYHWDGTKWKTMGIGYNPVNDLRDELEPRIEASEKNIEDLSAQSFEALRRSYAEAGLNLVDGSFEEGGTLTSASDVLLHKASGIAYSGSIGQVAAGTDPAAVGSGYVPRMDIVLRDELLAGALRIRDGMFALRDIVSVADYCTPGDGIREGTADATSIFQQAINELHAIGGGTLYIPSGTYIIRSVDIYSNIHLYGAGWSTILKHPVGYNGRLPTPDSTWPWEVDGMFTANFGGLAGTPNLADNINDISFRNIWFHGTSVEDGFLETLNLLCLTAVSNVNITGCKFTGFRGDAIDFPTGSIIHGDNERHCSNLYIAHNYFDGLNYNNRQCISIYDCVGAIIEDNYMTRCTHSTMPGAIDLEPGGAINPSMLNIVIRNNRFVDIGAAQDKPGIACLLSEITDQTKFGNIRIYDNYMSKCSGLQLLGINTVTDSLQYKIIDVSHNTFIGVTRGLVTRGLYGIEFTANKFESTTSSMLIGSPGASGNLIFRGNTFQYCSSVDGYTALLYEVRGLKFIDNMFIDCGRSDGTLGDVLYSIGGAPVAGLEIINNTFWRNGQQMHQVLRNADGAVDTSTLLIEDNKLIGDVVIGFPQRSHGSGIYAGAPNGTAVNLFKLEVGTYYITTNVAGDAVNFGATATVVVGAVSTRITANNTSFVTLSVADGFITASQISGGNQNIQWQYTKL